MGCPSQIVTLKFRKFPLPNYRNKVPFKVPFKVPAQIPSNGLQCNSHLEIYDIGTEIINLQCSNYSQNGLFCKSIVPKGIKNPGLVLVLYFGSDRIRFKAFWDISLKIYMGPWVHRLRFPLTFAPGGRLSYGAYNVALSKYTKTKISAGVPN